MNKFDKNKLKLFVVYGNLDDLKIAFFKIKHVLSH